METTTSVEPTLGELVELGQFNVLREKVEKEGRSINERNQSGGDSALHVACSKVLSNAVDYLLSHGADSNLLNSTGASPLHKLAASPLARDSRLHERVVTIAQALIDHGADAGLPNGSGVTALSMAPFEGLRDKLRAACHVDTINVGTELLPRLIGKNGFSIESLRTKHGVAIDTQKPSPINSSQPEFFVPVMLTGSKERVVAAKAEIEELMEKWRQNDISAAKKAADVQKAKEEFAAHRALDDTITTIPVPKQFHKRIIGVKMATLRALQSEFDVEIIVPPPTSEEETVTIKGKQDSVASAAERIMAMVKGGNPPLLIQQQYHKQQQQRKPLHINRPGQGEQQQQEGNKKHVSYTRAPINIIGIKTNSPHPRNRSQKYQQQEGESTTSETTKKEESGSTKQQIPVIGKDDPTPAEAAAAAAATNNNSKN